MENLVRIGVADPTEQMRIGQRAFERVVVLAQNASERWEISLDHVDPARVVLLQCRASADDKQRRLPLRSRLRQDQRAMSEVEREQPNLSWDSCARLLP